MGGVWDDICGVVTLPDFICKDHEAEGVACGETLGKPGEGGGDDVRRTEEEGEDGAIVVRPRGIPERRLTGGGRMGAEPEEDGSLVEVINAREGHLISGEELVQVELCGESVEKGSAVRKVIGQGDGGGAEGGRRGRGREGGKGRGGKRGNAGEEGFWDVLEVHDGRGWRLEEVKDTVAEG